MTNIKYLILAGCLSLPGCGSDEINLEPVTSDIGLEVAEIHPKTDAIPQLSLTMETTEYFPCHSHPHQTTRRNTDHSIAGCRHTFHLLHGTGPG